MKSMICLGFVVVLMVAVFPLGIEGGRFAVCKCRGCRPEKFYCNYNTFGGCLCSQCRCLISKKPPSHTCCSTCNSGWWGKKARKCWQCPIGRGCRYENCGCW